MADPSLPTDQLQLFLQRWHGGDLAARDELLVAVRGRLEQLARRMLHGFPNVQRYADTDDILQDALVRLCRSLEALRPTEGRAFWGLAAVHLRRTLLDLARRFGRREAAGLLPAEGGNVTRDAADAASSSSDLLRWQAFHETVERLADEEREVVNLVYYHGWTHAQAAQVLGISPKTVQRRWQAALWKISGLCNEPPSS